MHFADVSALSDDDEVGAAPTDVVVAASIDRPPGAQTLRKRRRSPFVQHSPKAVASDDELAKKLNRDCSCKRKTCYRQFLENGHFQEYKTFLQQWLELSKIDQDNIAS